MPLYTYIKIKRFPIFIKSSEMIWTQVRYQYSSAQNFRIVSTLNVVLEARQETYFHRKLLQLYILQLQVYVMQRRVQNTLPTSKMEVVAT